MTSKSTDLPDYILKAIKEGEADAEAVKQEKKALDEKRRKDEIEFSGRMLLIAREWTEQELPDLIRKETAIGKHELYLGSSDYDNKNINTLTKVKACQEIGLNVKESSYKAEIDVDGAYGHGDGCTYYIIW